ncbi:Polysialic acid transport protein KpsD [Polaribacter huanghezhanensis]|uniref:SLBB domain-containing protein n=1 Tax=Polaribacter huanghezhanensis TaxID=1354726 RepID=UPI0026477731|nr:SLBB domain-containing protein [Polaribacter huanghezhanensis]WKD86093.1 Polysialic acid transport protein KpsD [Polaribacter huanghezhanensis]
MKKRSHLFLIIFLCFFTSIVLAQDISQLKNINISNLSDDQIESYWNSIQKKGYTMEQVELLAETRGVSSIKIAEFKRRVNNLNTSSKPKDKKDDTVDKDNANDSFGLKGDEDFDKEKPKELLFGFDFFNNPKITFTPNINIAVPENYQLGPGDELIIDLWGATELTYKSIVNNQGNIKVEGVGQIYVNGFTIENASKKIISKLKKKHAGIGASSSSYNKINTNITVSKIRTVQINIIGEVKVPGTYSLNSLSTVLNALYVAGGPTKTGTFREVKLVRKGEVVGVLDIYNYLLKGSQKGNLKLQDQDVLLVGSYQNLVTVEGAVKRPGIYELKKGQTLDDLIQYFGGFTPEAYTDLLVLERVNGKQKEVKEVQIQDAKNFLIKGGDKLIVQEVVDKYKNKISLKGEVYRPGNYELLENMTLKSLIEKAEGVTPEAFLSRGLLVRAFDDTNKQNIAFSVLDILNGKTSIVLKANDEIRIFNKQDLREKRTISIDGAVNNPATFDFIGKLQIEDVIAMSGGLTEGADPQVVHVSRRLKDGSFKTLSKNFTISSQTNLVLNDGKPFYIEPFDIINVRYLKGYASQKKVIVKGEVKYQGSYVLINKNERISDLIKRAGGLTPFAYVKGATLVRENEEESVRKQEELLKKINEKDSITNNEKKLEREKDGFKIGIDLDKILNRGGAGTDIDLFLEEGDELLIPSEKQTIEVRGEVLSPALIHYKHGKGLKSYVNNSGGFSQKAKKSKIFVVYSNGDIKAVRSFLFFRTYPKLEPGAIIFVPSKTESKNQLSTQEILGITSSIGTIALIIQSLKK